MAYWITLKPIVYKLENNRLYYAIEREEEPEVEDNDLDYEVKDN